MRDRGHGVERALLATIAAHAVAMVAMAGALLPMMPGGSTHDDAARMAAIATHATAWRLGWATWGVTALSDVALGIALVAWRRVPRALAWLALGLVGAAVVPDQLAQVRWVTEGVELARAGDLPAYLAYEHDVFVLTAAWAALLYTAASVAWCACFAAAGAWDRRLTLVSVPLFALFAAAAVAPLRPASIPLPSWLVGAANAAGFVGLQVWLVLLLRSVRTVRCGRPPRGAGRLAG